MKWESLRDALKIWVRRIMARFSKHLATSFEIRSYPGDFLSEYFKIVNLTSLGERCLIGSDIGRCDIISLECIHIIWWEYVGVGLENVVKMSFKLFCFIIVRRSKTAIRFLYWRGWGFVLESLLRCFPMTSVFWR